MGSILGNRVTRVEDPRFLTSGGQYVDDIKLDGAVHVVYVRSPFAHARINGVDVDRARAMAGVVSVLTGEDLGLPPTATGMGGEAFGRPDLRGRHQPG